MKTFSKQPGDEKYYHVPCPLCFSQKGRLKFDCSTFSFYKCPCGCVYQNPRPDEVALIDRYDGEYFDYEKTEEKQFLELMLKGLSDVDFFKLSSQYKDSGVLDIGCATGILLESLRKDGYKVCGLEVCRESAEYGVKHRGLDIRINTLEDEAFPSGGFRFIHSSHVIEHIPDPAAFVRELYRISTDGGYVFITTPNASGLQAKIYKEKWRSCIPDHVVLFSKKKLLFLLKNEGFSIIKYKTWGGLAVGAGHPVLKKVLDPLAKMFGFGDVMIIAARKSGL